MKVKLTMRLEHTKSPQFWSQFPQASSSFSFLLLSEKEKRRRERRRRRRKLGFQERNIKHKRKKRKRKLAVRFFVILTIYMSYLFYWRMTLTLFQLIKRPKCHAPRLLILLSSGGQISRLFSKQLIKNATTKRSGV